MNIPHTSPTARTLNLIAQAKETDPSGYARAMSLHPSIAQIANPDVFAWVLGAGSRPNGCIISVGHGHGAFAHTGINRIAPAAKAAGCALAVVEWWDGADTYLSIDVRKDAVSKLRALLELNRMMTPEILTAFSRGATDLYSMVFDLVFRRQFVGAIIDNGSCLRSYAPNEPLFVAAEQLACPLLGYPTVVASGKRPDGMLASRSSMVASAQLLEDLGSNVLLMLSEDYPTASPRSIEDEHGWFWGSKAADVAIKNLLE